jgi:anti-sigma factor RsiW
MGKPCEDRKFEIQELLDGELPALEAAKLTAHLAGCAGCRAYEASMAGLLGRLDQTLRAPGPAPQLEVPAFQPVVVPFRPRRRAWTGWAAAAAAVVLAVGVALPRAHAPVDVATATSAPPAAAADLNDDGQAILTWFGPDEESEADVIPL